MEKTETKKPKTRWCTKRQSFWAGFYYGQLQALTTQDDEYLNTFEKTCPNRGIQFKEYKFGYRMGWNEGVVRKIKEKVFEYDYETELNKFSHFGRKSIKIINKLIENEGLKTFQ